MGFLNLNDTGGLLRNILSLVELFLFGVESRIGSFFAVKKPTSTRLSKIKFFFVNICL